MAKFWGNIGLNRGPVETSPGVLEQVIEEVPVQGEMRQQVMRWSQQEQREKLSAQHVLSIVTPEDQIIDFTEAVYIVWVGRKWAVTSINYKRPRVELSLGGIYNG